METLEVTGYMSDEVQLTLQRVKDDFVKAYGGMEMKVHVSDVV
jgi:hypothetical protein